jgi:folate-binding protein YgfZ
VNRDDFERQHGEVVGGAGFVRLEGWSIIRVTGNDRAAFLHNMCTNDIKSLQPGQSCEAFFTDVKGKIVGHAFVLATESAILLLGVPSQAEKLIAHLDRYIIREDVRLSDESDALGLILLLGAQSDEWVRSHAAAVVAVGDAPLWCGGALLVVAADKRSALEQALAAAGAARCDPAVWHAVRVESAWPLFGVDFDDSNLPQEVNRDVQAIHFRKGCYLGQETVARIDALGHVNKRLVLVQFACRDVPVEGTEVIEGDQAVGRVTSGCWSPGLSAVLGLAMVRRGHNEVGSQLSWARTSGVVTTPGSLPQSSAGE